MTEPITPREAVARIIDPHAWSQYSEHLQLVAKWSDGRPDPANLADGLAQNAQDLVRKSLAKADAILALLPDSPALTALKLAAVEWDRIEPTSSFRWQDAQTLFAAARAFAKEQRVGSDG